MAQIAQEVTRFTTNSNALIHSITGNYFFHTPIMISDALSKAQQFEEAMKWYHYVFNPIADGDDDKRFWQFTPRLKKSTVKVFWSRFLTI